MRREVEGIDERENELNERRLNKREAKAERKKTESIR